MLCPLSPDFERQGSSQTMRGGCWHWSDGSPLECFLGMQTSARVSENRALDAAQEVKIREMAFYAGQVLPGGTEL